MIDMRATDIAESFALVPVLLTPVPPVCRRTIVSSTESETVVPVRMLPSFSVFGSHAHLSEGSLEQAVFKKAASLL